MSAWPRFDVAAALAVALATGAPTALAHQSSDAYLFFDAQPGQTTLRWDIALRDLDAVLALDSDGDRRLTWGEIRSAWPRIDALALRSLQVAGCRFAVTGHALERRPDGAYAVLNLAAPCPVAGSAEIRYGLLADIDPTHRGIARLGGDGATARVRMLVPGPMTAEQPAAAQPHAPSFIAEGVHHIVTGYDHLLFLLCLLLPAVLWRAPGAPSRWQAVADWRAALSPVVRTVTLFTLAHSVTLALASLGWVRLSPSFVEPAIAVTIMLAAADNLRPWLLRWRGAVTFGFGLIHGFGFAGVLGELQLPPSQFGWALFQFNLGLELGQLAMVAAVVPMLFMLRHRAAYVPLVLRSGSVLALALAAVWLAERTTDWSAWAA